MDPALFYAGLRKRDSGLFGTSLSQGQVNGLERLLDTWDRYYSSDPIEFLAYDLATSYHETGATMQPIRENLNYSSEGIRNTFPKHAQAFKRQSMPASRNASPTAPMPTAWGMATRPAVTAGEIVVKAMFRIRGNHRCHLQRVSPIRAGTHQKRNCRSASTMLLEPVIA